MSNKTASELLAESAVPFDEACMLVMAMEKRIEELEESHRQIKQWCEAYPLDIFPEPDFIEAAKVLKAHGMTIDAISASNMRYVLRGIKQLLTKEQGEKV